jgi:ubiquinone biosynthesis protein
VARFQNEGMIIASLERLRAVPRLLEIARVLGRHGLADLVHSAGVHRVLEEAGHRLGWEADPAVAALPLPERVRLALEALGPAFTKLGQVLASRVDLLGPQWTASLERLHDQAHPVAFESLRGQLESDLGMPVGQAFARFDEKPAAAGSVAQVHRATLAGDGEVAVKIRRPGVEAAIEADVILLETLAAWWEEQNPDARRYQPLAVIRQLRKSLAREVDFTAEARAQQRLAQSFRDDDAIVVPKVRVEFTTPSLLVMDWIDGIPATDMEAVDRAGMDRALLAARGADAVLKMVLVDGFFHADPHPGNVIFLPGNRVAIIDFGMAGWISAKRRDELVDLLAAVAARDPDAMRNVLLGWADGSRVHAERFSEDLGRLLHLYENAVLREIHLGTLLSEIAGVMREHHLVLPADLALLFKALITLEGLGTRLVPHFRLVEHVTPWVKRLLAERWDPRNAATRFSGAVRESGRALRAAPQLIEALARRLGDDGVAIRLEMREVDRFSRHLESSVNRLTIGLVTAALIVGSAILMSFAEARQSFAGWFLSGCGVAIAFVNSLWLIGSIRRSRR